MTQDGRRILFDVLYWLGMASTLGCIALILTGNSDFGYRFEHAGFPFSWTLGGIAVAAFLGAEVCHRPAGALEDETSFFTPQEVEV